MKLSALKKSSFPEKYDMVIEISDNALSKTSI